MSDNHQEIPLAKVITPPVIDHEKEGICFKEGVEYVSHDGRAYHMDIQYPANAQGKLPAVIWVHGGGWSDENLTRKYLPSREIADLVKRGYVAASIDYRLSLYYHVAPQARYPIPQRQLLAAIDHVRSHAEEYHVDPEHIAAWGESAGGHLVELMAFTTDDEFVDSNYPGISSRIQAVIPWYAPYDLREKEGEEEEGKEVYRNLFAYEDEQERRRVREAASPVTYAARSSCMGTATCWWILLTASGCMRP